MKIIFFGTPQFSVPFLKELHNNPNIDVLEVVTQPDKPKGRGNKIEFSEVKKFALENNLPIFQPEKLNTDEVVNKFKEKNADAFVVVAYGKLIPKSLINISVLGCINVHPSLLPKYRGPSPIQLAILNGDPVTGITIMLLDEGMDTGPILASYKISIDTNETYFSLAKKMFEFGPSLLASTLKRLYQDEIIPMIQDNSKASITSLLTKDDGKIIWNESVKLIERKIRAYYPWPGAWILWNKNGKNLRIKIHEARVAKLSHDKDVGTLFIKDNQIFVSASNGTIELLTLQMEGKPSQKAKEFINGYYTINDTKLVF